MRCGTKQTGSTDLHSHEWGQSQKRASKQQEDQFSLSELYPKSGLENEMWASPNMLLAKKTGQIRTKVGSKNLEEVKEEVELFRVQKGQQGVDRVSEVFSEYSD